ncbi:ATP-binding protein [Gorillibacterium sp. sgz5001074]|uniref:ATP-binding protein n=1 Tax=Gorillibacterium sp. sgz5001074 TaxID=3446695 RepID=UPI003F676C55
MLAALLIFIGTLADVAFMKPFVGPILYVRLGMTAVALTAGWLADRCKTRYQAELTASIGILCITGGFATLGHLEGAFIHYIDALYQMLIFVLLFIPMRTAVFSLLTFTIGAVWFGPAFVMDTWYRDSGIWLSHATGYLIYSGILVSGHVILSRLRSGDQERKINLVQRAKQLELRTEELMRENERKYEMLLRLSPEPTLLHDGTFIHFANEAFLRLAQVRSLEELRGRELHAFTHPGCLEKAAEHYSAAAKDEGLKFQVYRFVLPRDESIEVEACSIALPHLMGDRRMVQTVLRDLTTRKMVEEKLGRSDKMSAVGQMAAGVAHEIKNPLTSLKGFVQLLRKKAPDHSTYYDIMSAELDRIHAIVNDFMMIAKPKQVEFKEQPVQDLIRHVISLLESQAYLSHIKLIQHFDAVLPPVMGDGNQLKQVFINLLKNAIEAMPDGGHILVRMSRRPEAVNIQISDEGVGIPPDKLQKLGEPFYTTKENGTGLGLNVCYRIIEEHRGHLYITSRVGEGTTVEIVLPAL